MNPGLRPGALPRDGDPGIDGLALRSPATASVDQIYAAGNPPQSGGSKLSIGMWIIIGIAILTAILVVVFVLSMLFGKKSSARADEESHYRGKGPPRARGDDRYPPQTNEEYEGDEYDPNPAGQGRGREPPPPQGFQPREPIQMPPPGRQSAPPMQGGEQGPDGASHHLGAPVVISPPSGGSRFTPPPIGAAPAAPDMPPAGRRTDNQDLYRRGTQQADYGAMGVEELVRSSQEADAKLVQGMSGSATQRGEFTADGVSTPSSRQAPPPAIAQPEYEQQSPYQVPEAGSRQYSPSTAKASASLMRAFSG